MTWRQRAFPLFASSCAMISAASHARAQCEPVWQPREGAAGLIADAGAGGYDWVSASAVWDPDASGPQSEVLVMGGSIQVAGDHVVKNVAMWDGQAWSPIGSLEGTVRALHVHQGDLYAGTAIPAPSTSPRVLRWSGSDWQAVGGDGPSDQVRAFASYQGELVVGGYFKHISGVQVNGIGRWNGQEWQPFGTGLIQPVGYVLSVDVLSGDLIAGGKFADPSGGVALNIARWDGAAWTPMGQGFNGDVYVVRAIDGVLYAGGAFTKSSTVTCNYIARWDGQAWQPMGTGLPSGAMARAIHMYDGQLYAGHNTATLKRPLSRWDGQAWQTVAKGPMSTAQPGCRTLCTYQDKLVVGGMIEGIDGQQYVKNVVMWDGAEQTWVSMPEGLAVPAHVAPFHRWKDSILLKGDLNAKVPLDYDPNQLLQWSGGPPSELTNMGAGINPTCFEEHDGNLYAGGTFQLGQGVNRIAKWDGSSWSPFDLGIASGSIRALHSVDGQLLAGGQIYVGVPGSHGVAIHDGVSWVYLGTGLPQMVELLTSYGGEPIASHKQSPSNENRSIYRWHNGQWMPMGLSFKGEVRSLLTHNGFLYAGVGASSTPGVYRWGGNKWTSVGTPGLAGVADMHVIQGRLMAMETSNGLTGVLRQLQGDQWATIQPSVKIEAISSLSGLRFEPWKQGIVVLGSVTTEDGRYGTPWVEWTCVCPADCDGSGSLDVNDFACFQTLFATGHAGADCDGSGSLDIGDFVCFQTSFAVGC